MTTWPSGRATLEIATGTTECGRSGEDGRRTVTIDSRDRNLTHDQCHRQAGVQGVSAIQLVSYSEQSARHGPLAQATWIYQARPRIHQVCPQVIHCALYDLVHNFEASIIPTNDYSTDVASLSTRCVSYRLIVAIIEKHLQVNIYKCTLLNGWVTLIHSHSCSRFVRLSHPQY